MLWALTPALPVNHRWESGFVTAPLPLTDLTARNLWPVQRFFVRHPMAMDAAIIVFFAVPPLELSVETLIEESEPWGTWRFFWAVTLTIVGAVALVWRRRQPVIVATVMTVVALLSSPLTHTLVNLMFGLPLVM